ncbi:MAG: TolC family protein [Chitinophagaceae bacterium]|nr:TolC family protein [Chitinophagaceae bacterium]
MFKLKRYTCIGLLGICLAGAGCKVPAIVQSTESKPVPGFYEAGMDSVAMTGIQWRTFFTDQNLVNLIDTALTNNQELLITLQEIEMAKNDIRIRQAPLLPTVGARAGLGVEKVGRYTSQGAGDASTDIKPGKGVPDVLTNFGGAFYANWEVDIWNKLHTAKQAAVTRYLATLEGKNFVLTNLVAEVANSYYELLALDTQLDIVRQNINLQKNALDIVKVQKEAARVTELAVQKFQAEVLKSQSLEFAILQNIKETENRINLLLARYPQPVVRNKSAFLSLIPQVISTGLPSQLLVNRPDIRQAELNLAAAKLDVKVARAEFYPSLGISAALGLQAFKPSYLVKLPESILFSLAGDIAGPLINRMAIKAEFANANARQLQALYNYERSILNAYLDVVTQLSKIDNLGKSYDLKLKQVDALNLSTNIANDLFRSARADYFEVLMTQRDALEARLELVETKKDQLNTVVNIFRNLGGGWQ